MKKSLPLFVFVIAAAISTAQSPRMVLFEEFTGENCGPCAASNPAINALLADPTNEARVAAIKWEVPIPSAPSKATSLYQTNKAEIDWRFRGWNGATNSGVINPPTSNGYGYPSQWVSTDPITSGVNSAPQGRLDGQYLWTFGASSNHGGNLSNQAITNAENIPSPFTITMERDWNTDATAITLTITVTASTNYTATGALVFRTVMVEKHIEFATPSGSNGEKIFKDVAIKSFPNIQSGTPLTGTWTLGQSHTFTLNCTIPAYTRKKTEIGFVGFIQDDGTRKVEQAAKLDKEQLPYDAKAAALQVQPACTGTVNASVVIENTGLNPITNLTITPYTDGTSANATHWTGSILPGASGTIALDPVTSPPTVGAHTFSYNITAMNAVDMDAANNSRSVTFLVATEYQAEPLVEGFSGVFPPQGWTRIDANPQSSWIKTTQAGGYNLSQESMMMGFFTNTNMGEVEEMILPPVDLSGTEVPVLDFLYAYARRGANNQDRLEILASKDCGQTWTTLFDRKGLILATVLLDEATNFIPEPSEWKQESLLLNDFNNATVLIKLRTTNGNGNNLFIDDINLRQPSYVSLTENASNGLIARIFPNPSRGQAVLEVSSSVAGSARLTMVNVLGQNVLDRTVQLSTGSNSIDLNLGGQASGIYYVTLQNGKSVTTTKLTITN